MSDQDQAIRPWQRDIYSVFKAANVEHVSYVPDGGHRGLINLCTADPEIRTTVLTTEEEGVGLAAGLFLGGQRSVLLMQSSGVGNCLNLSTLAENCRLPLVLLVTIRGEFAEFVPWQVPMGQRAGCVGADGLRCLPRRRCGGSKRHLCRRDRPSILLQQMHGGAALAAAYRPQELVEVTMVEPKREFSRSR